MRRSLLAVMAVSLLVAACTSSAPSPSAGARTIAVTGSDDFRWEPDAISVRVGETITFEVTNAGQIVHEFFIGDEAAQEEHEVEMTEGGMQHGDEPAISIQPGETESLEYTFEEAGELLIGCHEPGHYAAGMVATIEVAP